MTASTGNIVLRVEGLRVSYQTTAGALVAADGIDFELERGARLGLVGESGCGKTTTAMALMRLIKSPGRIDAGRVWLDDRDLLQLTEEEMRRVRFSRISLIPQAAMNALNPVMRVGQQIVDTIAAHEKVEDRNDLAGRVEDLLQSVDLAPDTARAYPHELSGGMKQRVCMAMAVALSPQVIIADEPTSALDVVVQKRVMETLRRVQQDLGAALVLVGHDMGLMAQSVDRIGVMYAGRLVEVGRVDRLLEAPLHPYTRLLVASLPSVESKGAFQGIPGLPPSLLEPPPGCPFHPRCPDAVTRCGVYAPSLVTLPDAAAAADGSPERQVACLLHEPTVS